jgi:HSP20 family protein
MYSLVEWHKREIDNIRKEIDGVFNRFFNFFELGFASREEEPYFDLFDGRDQVVIRAKLPGLEAEDLDITIHDNVLTIKGEVEGKSADSQAGGFEENRLYRFARSLKLPCPIGSDRVEAIYKNGVLTIYLPKQRVKGRKHIIITVR